MTIRELYQKYPKIFVQMEDGYYAISSDVPKGWMKTVDFLCESIQSYTDNINENNKHLPPVEQTIVDQVKEKWANLCFYIHGGNDEINGMIEQYANKFPELKVILCGGDAPFFENQLKRTIFAAPDLVLMGLNRILRYNA